MNILDRLESGFMLIITFYILIAGFLGLIFIVLVKSISKLTPARHKKPNKYLKIIFLPLWLIFEMFRFFIHSPFSILHSAFLRLPYRVRQLLFIFAFLGLLAIGTQSIFKPKSIEAAWYNDNWTYRKSIAISAHTSLENNVYLNLTGSDDLDTSDTAKFQADCGDLRFTDASGNLLPYYIDSGCGTSATVVHVLLDTFPAGAQTFFFYYGNPSALNGFEAADFATAASAVTFGSQGSEEKSPGPVAWFKFDEGTGTTVKDASSNGNNGTTSGPTWQAEDLCVRGKCLWFDNVDDYVQINDSTNLRPTAITLSAWIRPQDVVTDNILFRKQYGTSSTKSANLGLNNGELLFEVCSSAPTCVVAGDVPATGLSANKWYFVVGTYDGSTVSLYIDGVRVAYTAGSVTIAYDTNPWFIGAGSYDADQAPDDFYAGFIDEPKIYNYARSAAQVKLDFNNSGINKGAGAVLGSANYDSLSNGLAGYWKLNESSGNAADSSGNGLTLTNNGTTTYTTGKFFNGSEHVPASSQYLSTATTISGVKSVSFWTNPDSTTNYFISLTSGAYVTASSGVLSATGFTSPKIYVNGVETTTIVADSWQLVTVTTETGIDANQFYAGRQGSNYYDGTLDEVRTYNRVLSPAEVAQLYNFAPGPVGYWKMEEGGGTTTDDSSGNGKTSSAFTGNVAWATGKYGKGLTFDGDDDVVRFTESSQLDLGLTTDSYTVTAWFKNSTNYSTSAYIAAKYDGTGTIPFALYIDTSEQPSFVVSASGAPIANASTAYTDGNWHFLAGVRDVATDTVALYVDGILVESTADTTTASAVNDTDVSIGNGHTSYTSRDFNGDVDEVKIYNYARNQKQVIEDMNAGHPAPGSPVGSAAAYWKFDEGYGTTTYDSSINGLSGTLNGFTSPATSTSGWTNSGKIGKALNYDRVDNYISRADSSALKPPQISVSAWVYLESYTGDPTIYNKIYTGGNSVYLYVDESAGLLRGWLNCCAGGTPFVTDTEALPLNSWQHVAFTYDGANMKLYRNGALRKTHATTASITYDTSSLLIGAFSTTPNGLWDGLIDEMKMYPFALTAAEILVDYNQGQALVLGTLGNNSNFQTQATGQQYCIPGDTTTCTAPVAQWQLEEGSGTTANDISGNANTGTITAGTGGYTSGKIGKGYSFDNADTLVNAGSASTLDNLPASGMAIQAWIYPAGMGESSAGFIMAKNVGTTPSSGWLFSFAGTNALTFTVDGSTDLVRTTNNNLVTLNAWNHVVMSWDGVITTAATADIYINGVEATYATTTNGASRVDDGTSTFFIGNDSTSARTFNGKIDEVRVYNYSRTPAQIAYDYNRGAPLAHWKLDECQGTTANDSSGNQYTGTITVGSGTHSSVGTCATSATTMWYDGRNGKYNSSLSFDGSDDYVTMGDTLSQDGTTPFSMSAWVNLTDDANTQVIMGKSLGSGSFVGYILYKGDDSDGLSFNFRNTAGTNFFIGGSKVIADGTWHHVVATFTGNSNVSGMKTYIDGKLDTDGSGAGSAFSGTLTTTAPFSIGSRGGTGPFFTNGQIDDAKYFNYTLTDSQVKILYNQASAVQYAPISGIPQ